MTRLAPQVVYVSAYFPPDLGGTERVAAALADRMAARRPVQVVTSRPRGGDTGARSSARGDVDVRRLRALVVAKVPLMPGLVPALLRTPRRAVLHLHLGQALVPELVWLAAALRRQSLVLHFHLDISPSGPFGPVFVAYKRLVLPRLLRAADAVVCLTPEQAAFLTGVMRVRPERVRVVPNAVGDAWAAVDRPPVEPLDRPLRLLYAGRLSQQKNLPRLLEAVRLCAAPVELAMAGDGELREELSRRLPPNATLLGALDEPALVERFAWADVLVLTSDAEGMPLVLLEAMRAGLPVVATDVPGVRATVGDAALVVPPTAAAVAEAVDRLAADAGLRDELSRRGRERSRGFSWTAVLDGLEVLYDELAAPSASRSRSRR